MHLKGIQAVRIDFFYILKVANIRCFILIAVEINCMLLQDISFFSILDIKILIRCSISLYISCMVHSKNYLNFWHIKLKIKLSTFLLLSSCSWFWIVLQCTIQDIYNDIEHLISILISKMEKKLISCNNIQLITFSFSNYQRYPINRAMCSSSNRS
jgi:hypothetical protein